MGAQREGCLCCFVPEAFRSPVWPRQDPYPQNVKVSLTLHFPFEGPSKSSSSTSRVSTALHEPCQLLPLLQKACLRKIWFCAELHSHNTCTYKVLVTHEKKMQGVSHSFKINCCFYTLWSCLLDNRYAIPLKQENCLLICFCLGKNYATIIPYSFENSLSKLKT